MKINNTQGNFFHEQWTLLVNEDFDWMQQKRDIIDKILENLQNLINKDVLWTTVFKFEIKRHISQLGQISNAVN